MPLQAPDTPLADTAEPVQGTQLSCGRGRKTLLPKVCGTWESTAGHAVHHQLRKQCSDPEGSPVAQVECGEQVKGDRSFDMNRP